MKNGRQHQAELIGVSPVMMELREEIERVAPSDAKILVSGESGVGKELVSRAIHTKSPRARAPFLAVNCAGLSDTLLESEFFGHVKGSFTGAHRDKPGMLELADSGTVFLDEISEMTLHMQGLLLRFLETGELRKVGADHPTPPVDVRIVAATNRDLREMMRQRIFRQDLFYRLDVIHLVVPPLRSRPEDIPLLIDHFLTRFSRNNGSMLRAISPEALARLMAYPWPGNVRELENVIERLVVRTRSPVATADHLPSSITTPPTIPSDGDAAPHTAVAVELHRRLTEERESFWSVVYPRFMRREITNNDVRDIVRCGLAEAHGSYKVVTRLFNMKPDDYKRFLTFLRKHDCHVPFREYR